MMEYPAASSRRRRSRRAPITALPIRWDTELYESDVCVTRVQVESGDQRKWTCDRGENDGFGSWERGGVVLLCVCAVCRG